jgi:ribonuclease D
LYQHLLLYRDKIAADQRVEPNSVIPLASLRDISVNRPKVLEDLARIPGMNADAIRRYGPDIIEIIVRCDPKPVSRQSQYFSKPKASDPPPKPPPPPRAPPPPASARPPPPADISALTSLLQGPDVSPNTLQVLADLLKPYMAT